MRQSARQLFFQFGFGDVNFVEVALRVFVKILEAGFAAELYLAARIIFDFFVLVDENVGAAGIGIKFFAGDNAGFQKVGLWFAGGVVGPKIERGRGKAGQSCN
jgi:hypothetical protein